MAVGGDPNGELAGVKIQRGAPHFTAISFDAIPGWDEDDVAAALSALQSSLDMLEPVLGRSQRRLRERLAALGGAACEEAFRQALQESYRAYRISGADGFVTGYYEPVVCGARHRGGCFQYPVYGRPNDLVTLRPELERARWNSGLTAARRSDEGLFPYYTRAEIEAGALVGRGLEIVYLDDPVELFYMQVQGSGLVVLDDGTEIRLSYAGKNGHPYRSIGQRLIARGEIEAEAMSMAALKAWLRADRGRARALMDENPSYIFFQALPPEANGPVGAQGVVLTPGRSLAVDGAIHGLGMPIFVDAPSLTDENERPFRRLMVAQDVGSAIQGPCRGDIFWGTGEVAGEIAGSTRHGADFIVLLPCDDEQDAASRDVRGGRHHNG